MRCIVCNCTMMSQIGPQFKNPMHICLNCQYTITEKYMAKQQKKAVEVHKIANPRFGYAGQWTVSASPTAKTPNPDPYTISEAKDGNWSCSCMAWTRNHPREDCKHIMRVKLAESKPIEIQATRGMQFVQSTGRKFR
jgi:hypothetical protein